MIGCDTVFEDYNFIHKISSMQNHFELFHLPVQFALDANALDLAYREVQNQVHPDKFVTASGVEKRVAMQWATRANEAYHTLKNPMRRAAYLCELKGIDLQIESNTAMPPQFLMQQMEWREALEEARAEKDLETLAKLEHDLRSHRKFELEQIAKLFERDAVQEVAAAVRQLMFVEKLAQETAHVFNLLDE